MKKVQFKLKNKTRAFSLAMLATLVLFTGCNSYDDEITDLQGQIDAVVTDVATLKTSVAALQTSVSGMTYIKSITMGTDGKLTITPSVGNAIVYDAKNYVTYDIKLEGNNLIVNGANKGSVVIPPLTFENGVLKSGTAVVADLTSWMKSGLTVVDGFLAINGQKTTVAIPVDPGKTVKDVALDGTNVKVTYTDGTSTVFANVPFVASVSATTGNLVVNGVDTGVKIRNEYTVIDGYLAVNGVKTTVAIPSAKDIVLINPDNSVTVYDGTGKSVTIKVNPSNELLSSMLFVPRWIDGGVNAIEVGYINSTVAPIGKVLFNENYVTYRFNPTTADVSGTEFNFVNNSARMTAVSGQNAPGDATTLFAKPTKKTIHTDGSGTFNLKVNVWAEPTAGETHLIALQAFGKDFYSGKDSYVVSDYAKIVPAAYTALITKDTVAFAQHKNVNKTAADFALPNTATTTDVDYELVYNATTQPNINDFVFASGKRVTPVGAVQTLKKLGFGLLNVDYKFKFDLVTTYVGVDQLTKQSDFIAIDANGNISILKGTASIDRVPVVKVQLLTMANKVIAESFIKFRIVEEATKYPDPVTFDYTFGDIAYQSMFNGAASHDQDLTLIGGITWPQMNQIYQQLGVSHNKFLEVYGPLTLANGITASGKYGATNYTAAQLPQLPAVATQVANLIITLNQPNVDTYAFSLQANPLSKFGANEFSFVLTPSAADQLKYPVITLKFKYNVIAPVVTKKLLQAWQDPTGSDNTTTQGTNDGADFKMQYYLGEAFGYGDGRTALKAIFSATKVNDKIDAKHELIVSEYAGKPAGPQSYIVTGNGQTTDIDVLLGTAPKSGTLLKLANAITTTRVYPVNFKTTYPNAQTHEYNFTVTFKNPLVIDLASDASFVLTDKTDGTPDSKDLALNYVVKFLTNTIVNKGTTVANNFGLTNAGLAYELIATSNDYKKISLTAPSTVVWSNEGGGLLIQQVNVANAKVTYTASNSEGVYAVQTRTDVVSVKPQ